MIFYFIIYYNTVYILSVKYRNRGVEYLGKELFVCKCISVGTIYRGHFLIFPSVLSINEKLPKIILYQTSFRIIFQIQ